MDVWFAALLGAMFDQLWRVFPAAVLPGAGGPGLKRVFWPVQSERSPTL